ncbi:MAG TPA: AAA family ATPase, partial [Methanospirillum sp.]|uniref:AAA family ATPase n=1 Tax=Methanospirillum sp. TaxID=45200 RepID=UPI002CFEF1EE
KNNYLIDKSRFIEKLETEQNPVFLRPRRFGKSLFCSMLQYYYDINEADRFEELFGNTWIGKNRTSSHNMYIVLKLDFSEISGSDSRNQIEYSFHQYCNRRLIELKYQYPVYFSDMPDIRMDDPASLNLSICLGYLKASGAPPVYVIIDEYDNFVNQLITQSHDHLYSEITSGDSFLRAYYKVLKAGRQSGSVANIFITGVLPVTIDDLSSAYNIATFITLDPVYEHMLGFTQNEVDTLMDEVYRDYEINPITRVHVEEVIKNMYNGYHFVKTDTPAVYNSTMLMFFFRQFAEQKAIPDNLFDLNLRTDLEWVRRLTLGKKEILETFISQLTMSETLSYNRKALLAQFNLHEFFEPAFYPVSLFYLGILTRKDEFSLQIPNLTIKEMVVEYFNEVFRIDPVQDKYEKMMREFVAHPDLFRLFSEYWRLYISQLPESVFMQVNENFYRTTFYEVCSRYLSPWFTWNIERSYPEGRSDLEFVGKYNERFAGLRWIIEFKYYSLAEFSRFNRTPETFELQAEHRHQVQRYGKGVLMEFPEAQVRLFVIYCFGNLGYRVFEVPLHES